MAGKLAVMRAAAALITDFVASNELAVAAFPNATLYLEYLNASSGANNSIQFFFEFSPDKLKWYRETAEELDVSTGVLTQTAIERTYTHVQADAATDLIEVPLRCPEQYVRVQAKETVASGAAGTLTISGEPQDSVGSRAGDTQEI